MAAKFRSFVDAVRGKQVTQPQQRSFTPDKWTKQYQEFPASEADGRLHEAGLWFFREFSAARSALDRLPELSAVADVRALAAFVNYEMTLAMRLPRDLTENKFSVHEETDRYESLGPGGTPVNRQAYIEGMISALSLPLRFLIRGHPVGNLAVGSVDAFAELGQHVRLAATYAQLENWWLECLWNGWYVDATGDVPWIRPGDLEHHANCMVGQYRAGVMATEYLIHLMRMWSDPAFQDINEWVIARSHHVDVSRKGRLTVHPLGRARAEFPRALDAILLGAEELYWCELMTRPLPNMNDVTIRQVLEAWRVMMEIGQSLQGSLNSQPVFTSVGSLASGYAHRVKHADLLKALATVDAAKAHMFLERFTFDGQERVDPWLHPLLRIGEDYAVIVSSLNTSNPVRLVEHWMTVGGLALDERGELFEQYVQTTVAAACRSSRFSASCEVSSAGFTFTPRVHVPTHGRTREEIDLAFRLGGTVLICEDKCCVYPVEPTDRYSYFERIREGRHQAARKAEFVRQHLTEFMKLYLPAYDGDVSAVRVVPLVITNLAFGSGSRSATDSVPVADLVMLTRYLQEGVVAPPSEFSRDGGHKALGKPLPLYRTRREFEHNIVPFLAEPPIINGYRKALSLQRIFMQLGDGRLQKVATLHIDPDEVERMVLTELASWTQQHCRGDRSDRS